MDELLTLCEYFYHAHHIPIYLYRGRERVRAIPGQPDSCWPDQDFDGVLQAGRVLLCYVTADNLLMGYIPIETPDTEVLLGPVSALPYTPERLSQVMRNRGIPPKDREEAGRLWQAVPNWTQLEFVDILLLFQFAATGKRITRDDFFRFQDEENPDQALGAFMQDQLYTEVDPSERHVNDDVLRFIESGDSDSVFRYLCNHPAPPPISFGTTPLAYQKHLCYYSVGLFSGAAQRGGLPPLESMEIAAAYYKEITAASTVEKVDQITGHAALFYAGRVASIKLPSDTKSILMNSIAFIRQHVYSRVRVSDVAALLGYSCTHTARLFKEELGVSPAQFIMNTKLEEAKSLLRYTDQSLSEISSALCFYDQSHFQRSFKAAFGMTPMDYRNKRVV